MNPTFACGETGIGKPAHDDFQEILDVWESSVRATHFFLGDEEIQHFLTIIPQLLECVDLYCTRDGAGRISGFLGTGKGKIEMLFIRADQRGKGLGGQLLRFAVQALGFRKVDVNEQNGQALRFYENAGFAVAGRSERDGLGTPYPLLHLEYAGSID